MKYFHCGLQMEATDAEHSPGGFVFEVELWFRGLFITSPPPFNLFKSWNLPHLNWKHRTEGKGEVVAARRGRLMTSQVPSLKVPPPFILNFSLIHWICILHVCMRCGHQKKSNFWLLLKCKKYSMAEPILNHSVNLFFLLFDESAFI